MDLGWTRYVEYIESANWSACISTALANGFTVEDAEMCDGDLCPNCPFKFSG
jgi:hypothetical protein